MVKTVPRAWFKFSADYISNPKIQRLPELMQLHFAKLLCMMSKAELDWDDSVPDEERDADVECALRSPAIGPDDADIASHNDGVTRYSIVTLKHALLRAKLIDSSWRPTGWDKWQAPIDPNGAKRQAKHRDKQQHRKSVTPRNASPHSQSRVTETLRDVDQNRLDKSEREGPNPSPSNVITADRRLEPVRSKPPTDWQPVAEHQAKLAALCRGARADIPPPNLSLELELFRATSFQFGPGEEWADKFTKFVIGNHKQARAEPAGESADERLAREAKALGVSVAFRKRFPGDVI